MASLHHLLPISIVIVMLTLSQASQRKVPKPTALIFPIRKDAETLQYYTTLQVTTVGNYVDVVIDLGGQHLWFDCSSYSLPTYLPIPCGSTKCEFAKGSGCTGCDGPARPGCTNNTCGAYDYNPFVNVLVSEGFGEEFMVVDSTNGRYIGSFIKSPTRLIFSCSDYKPVLEGLASKTKGVVGLSRGLSSNSFGLQTQISSTFKLAHKFALCIPSDSGIGNMFIGGGSYFMPPESSEDLSKSFISTPLLINPVSTAPIYTEGDPSDEYFIDVNSIKVGGKAVSLPTSLLEFGKNGEGGTKVSTIANYTVLHSTIYKPFVRAFEKSASSKKIKKVAAVAPFGTCFSSKTIHKTALTGPDVPIIDLVLPGTKVEWKIYGANSIVEVKKGVSCLAFVDGGKKVRTAVVLGGHQLENYLLEFDLSVSMFRFTTSLLLRNTTCSQSRLF